MNNSRIKSISILLLSALLLMIASYYMYNKNTLDIRKAKTEISINTDELSLGFKNKDSMFLSTYIEKAIEVEGTIHKVTYKKGKYTLLLKGQEIDTFVICELQEDQNRMAIQLEEGKKIQVKGILKGFLKDTILLNCIILAEIHE